MGLTKYHDSISLATKKTLAPPTFKDGANISPRLSHAHTVVFIAPAQTSNSHNSYQGVLVPHR